MESETPRASMKQRLKLEAQKLATITIYLFLFLATMSTYRTLILARYGIDYVNVGYSIVEAFVIAKVILIGEMLHVGEEAHGRPLIVTIVYKTIAFAFLVAAFKTVEHLIVGHFRDQSPGEVLHEMFVKDGYQTLAQTFLMFVAFIPFFTLREISRAMGKGRLWALLLSPRPKAG